jgi:hypothetical protein
MSCFFSLEQDMVLKHSAVVSHSRQIQKISPYKWILLLENPKQGLFLIILRYPNQKTKLTFDRFIHPYS